MKLTIRLVVASLITGSILASAPAVLASDGQIDKAKALLAAGERDKVEAGIQSLGLIGTKEAVEPLVNRIRQGLSHDLLETAIFTLMALGQPSSGPALFELAAHRRMNIRLRAVEAIAAVAPPGAEAVLVTALSDSDHKVRAAAATGLGEINAHGALETLFHALDRGNMEASQAIGKVLKPGQVKRLLGYLGKVPFRNLGPALGHVLQRSDVSQRSKLVVIARLQELGTPEVKGYLGDLLSSHGDQLPDALNRALLRAMQEIAD